MVPPITLETASQVYQLFVLVCRELSKHSSLLDSPMTHNVFVRVYCVAIDMMTQVKCYRAILEVSEVLPPQSPF